MQTLTAAPLTREAFAPFGDVIQVDDRVESFPINGGNTQRYHDQAQVQVLGDNARPIISIFRSQPYRFPISLELLERHPQGSQAFMPINGGRFVVVVAPPGGTIRAEDIRAFVTNGQQGVNFHAGVWHHPMLALDRVGDFLVVDRAGDGNNCDERDLPCPMTVSG